MGLATRTAEGASWGAEPFDQYGYGLTNSSLLVRARGGWDAGESAERALHILEGRLGECEARASDLRLERNEVSGGGVLRRPVGSLPSLDSMLNKRSNVDALDPRGFQPVAPLLQVESGDCQFARRPPVHSKHSTPLLGASESLPTYSPMIQCSMGC